MSQVIKNLASGPVPPAVPTSFVTDINSPSIPIANIENVFGGSVNTNNNNGIQTDGSSGSNTLTVQLTNRIQASVTTTNATPTTLFSFPLGATPATYNFDISFSVYDRTNNKGAAYKVLYGIRTDGSGDTAIGFTTPLNVEDPELNPTSLSVSQSGNNFTATVTGLIGATINWQAVGTYVKAF